jgi:hypothetical protein
MQHVGWLHNCHLNLPLASGMPWHACGAPCAAYDTHGIPGLLRRLLNYVFGLVMLPFCTCTQQRFSSPGLCCQNVPPAVHVHEPVCGCAPSWHASEAVCAHYHPTMHFASLLSLAALPCVPCRDSSAGSLQTAGTFPVHYTKKTYNLKHAVLIFILACMLQSCRMRKHLVLQSMLCSCSICSLVQCCSWRFGCCCVGGCC